jgi:hypothetical protein
VTHATGLDAAPKRGRCANVQGTAGDDVPLRHLAESRQPFGIDKSHPGAVYVDVFIGAERVERGTQQWRSGRVNLALHDHDRHVVYMKPMNLYTTIDQCHDILRPRPTAHSDST